MIPTKKEVYSLSSKVRKQWQWGVTRPVTRVCVGGMGVAQGAGTEVLSASPSALLTVFVCFFKMVSKVRVSGEQLWFRGLLRSTLRITAILCEGRGGSSSGKMAKLSSDALSVKLSADPTGSSEAGMVLQNCHKLEQEAFMPAQ